MSGPLTRMKSRSHEPIVQGGLVAHYFFRGERVLLRGVEREDYIECMLRWTNDPEFNRYLSHGIRPTTKAMMERLYEDLLEKENVIFAMVDPVSEVTMGIIGLHQFNWHNRSAEYAVHVGERRFQGTGAAGEATQFVLRHAFETLNLHKVWLGVNEANTRAVAFYEKMGFLREGVLRSEIFRENRYFGSLRMSMLRDEYER